MRCTPTTAASPAARGRLLVFGAIACSIIAWAPAVQAQGAHIVAVGASNTSGSGVGPRRAWPAQLEALLRARGYDVRIANAGISGDDTSGMLARIDEAVPKGTNLVILDKTDTNDRRRGVDTARNVAAIREKLHQRSIRVFVIPSLHAWSERRLQFDGIHIREDGHALVAEKLLPHVTAALGRPVN